MSTVAERRREEAAGKESPPKRVVDTDTQYSWGYTEDVEPCHNLIVESYHSVPSHGISSRVAQP